MSRLIDADYFTEITKANESSMPTYIELEDLIKSIDKIPTAFDKDKVLEELKAERIGLDYWEARESGVIDGLNTAIMCVERGGVE